MQKVSRPIRGSGNRREREDINRLSDSSCHVLWARSRGVVRGWVISGEVESPASGSARREAGRAQTWKMKNDLHLRLHRNVIGMVQTLILNCLCTVHESNFKMLLRYMHHLAKTRTRQIRTGRNFVIQFAQQGELQSYERPPPFHRTGRHYFRSWRKGKGGEHTSYSR